MSKFFRLISTLAVIVLIAVACNKSGGLKDTPPLVKLYQVKSAKIVYEYSGAASGTLTDIFANFGMYENKSNDILFNMGGKQSHVQTTSINNDTVTYVVDHAKKECVKTRSEFEMLKQYTANWNQQQKDNFILENYVRNGGERVGKETLLGKECDVVDMKMAGMKIWIWKGIMMKVEYQMGESKMIIAAKSIDADFSATAEMFEPPKDIPVKDQTKAPKGMPPGQNPH